MKTLFLFFLMVCNIAFAQVTDMEKDTIQMEELILKNNRKTSKKTLKLRGQCYYPEDMRGAEEIITLIEKLPEGYLESVTFYVNEAGSYNENTQSFKDTQLELVAYKANADNTPGERIAHEKLIINLDRKKKGKLTISLFELNLQNPEKFFIGLKKVNGSSLKKEFLLDCLCNGLDKYITLTRNDSLSGWERRWECAALKADVTVVITK
jgi:hypothetical protein